MLVQRQQFAVAFSFRGSFSITPGAGAVTLGIEVLADFGFGLDGLEGPEEGTGMVFIRFATLGVRKSVSSQARLVPPGESGKGGCAASCKRASTLMETLSGTHSQTRAVRPRSIQLSRAKLVDSAQFSPRLNPAW